MMGLQAHFFTTDFANRCISSETDSGAYVINDTTSNKANSTDKP